MKLHLFRPPLFALGLVLVLVLPDAGLAALPAPASGSGPPSDSAAVAEGRSYLAAGRYDLALDRIGRAREQYRAAGDPRGQARAEAAYGYALYLRERGRHAEPGSLDSNFEPLRKHLGTALELLSRNPDPGLEAWTRLALGMAEGDSGHTDRAFQELERARQLALGMHDGALARQAELQRARLETNPERRLGRLRDVAAGLKEPDLDDRSRVALGSNILDQLGRPDMQELNPAAARSAKSLGLELAERVREQARAAGMARELAEATAFLAEIQAADGDTARALDALEVAIGHAAATGAPDLLMRFETSRALLLANQGQEQKAIEAYRRADFHVQAVRNEIPIYQNGISTYREVLEPIYRGLADLSLRQSDAAGAEAERQRALLEAVRSLEALKKSEMEDYLNDRCAFESAPSDIGLSRPASGYFPSSPMPRDAGKDGTARALTVADGKTAILYPVVLPDRLDVLLIHRGTIRKQTVPVPAGEVDRVAQQLAAILRKGQDYRAPSGKLHQWLIAPVDRDLKTAGVERLVYIPDGMLRLVPLAVLSPDGHDFVARHYAVTTNSGFPQAVPGGGGRVGNALLAGMSKPSESVLADEDLPDQVLLSAALPLLGSNETARRGSGSRRPDLREAKAVLADPKARAAAAEALALPEVEAEIEAIRQILPGDEPILNGEFTKENLRNGFRSGNYEVAHISTHSYFGRSADESFVMAYDEVLKVDEVEEILKPAEGRKQPVELIIFSACQTAQGDERAPLGFSGLAIKTRARNAIGALWPISDKATKRFMQAFYAALVKNDGDKARALQEAQRTLIQSPDLSHPSFWAPFILIGQW